MRPGEKAEVVAAKYFVQYAFGAMSTAAIVPLIDSVGVGWAFKLCKYFADISRIRCKGVYSYDAVMFLDILGGLFILIIAQFSPDSWL